MGWAKYHEDIHDAKTDSEFLHKVSNYVTKSIDPPIFNCLYCNAVFYAKKDLYEHIKSEHSSLSAMVVVNGKIVHNECFIKELSSLIVIRYDLSNSVYVNKTILKEFDKENEVDITDKIKKELLQNKKVVITIGERTFKIHLIAQENIDLNKINATIFKWSEKAAKGLHAEKSFDASNELEKKCLNGLYNYFIACVSTGKDKDKRYNDAFAILSEVENVLPAATVVLRIIAFKFNWVEKLRLLSVGDNTFSMLYNFLSGKESKNLHVENGSREIFIEDELDEVIKIMVAYQEKRYDYVNDFAKKYSLRLISKIADVNQRDKVCLICARMAIRSFAKYEARRFYDEIQTPFFEEEKNNFIKAI